MAKESICRDVGMVQTRLAIIDLKTGGQPIYSRDTNNRECSFGS